MAIATTAIGEVWSTGSDTNGLLFDPALATGVSDLATTNGNAAAPTITSATYTFVAGDANSWLFVKSGTNWIPGWYQITSVAGGAATLNAIAGQAIIYTNSNLEPSTATGCCTQATPGGNGTGSIDYTQQAASPIASITDLQCSSTTTVTSTAIGGWTVIMVGNGMYVTGGGATTGRYMITAVASGTSITVDRTPGAVANGTGNVGGAAASLGQAWSSTGAIAGDRVYCKATATYSVGAAITPLAGAANHPSCTIGYMSLRTDGGQTTLQASAAVSLFTLSNSDFVVANFILDSNSQAADSLTVSASKIGLISNVSAIVSTGKNGFNLSAAGAFCTLRQCKATPASAATGTFGFLISQSTLVRCVADGVATGYKDNGNCPSFIECVARNCTTAGSTSAGSVGTYDHCIFDSCVIGINLTGYFFASIRNCILTNNSSTGIVAPSGMAYIDADYNAFYNNGANYSNCPAGPHDIILTGDPFTSASTGDYSTNNNAGAGAAVRAAANDAWLGLTTTSYRDVGAAQHQDTSTIATAPKFIILAR